MAVVNKTVGESDVKKSIDISVAPDRVRDRGRGSLFAASATDRPGPSEQHQDKIPRPSCARALNARRGPVRGACAEGRGQEGV